jgi:hypothetical protein
MFPPIRFTPFIPRSFVSRQSLRVFLFVCAHRKLTLRFTHYVPKPARPLMPYTSFQAGLAGISLRDLFRSFHSLHKTCPYSVVFPLVTLTEYEMKLILSIIEFKKWRDAYDG